MLFTLDFLPDLVSPGSHDVASAHVVVIEHFRSSQDLTIPTITLSIIATQEIEAVKKVLQPQRQKKKFFLLTC